MLGMVFECQKCNDPSSALVDRYCPIWGFRFGLSLKVLKWMGRGFHTFIKKMFHSTLQPMRDLTIHSFGVQHLCWHSLPSPIDVRLSQFTSFRGLASLLAHRFMTTLFEAQPLCWHIALCLAVSISTVTTLAGILGLLQPKVFFFLGCYKKSFQSWFGRSLT